MHRSSKKICMLVENDVVTDSRVLKEADSLSKKNFDVTIIALHNKGLKYFEYQNGFKIIRIIVYSRIIKLKILLPFKFIECFIRMFIVATKLKADFYHCHDISPMIAAWLAARINKSKLIYDSHELEYDRNFSRWLRLFHRLYEKIFINKVDHIIVSDGQYRAKIMQEKNNCNVPMTFVMNCPPKIEIDQKDIYIIREKLNIPKSKKIIVYIGKSMPGRGIRTILSILSQLENTILVFIGEYDKKQIQKWEEKYKISGKIKSIGPLHYNNVIKYISGADLGLVLIKNTCLSYYYSTPTKLFDCIAAGLPILTSDFPGMEDIIHNQASNSLGISVNPNNSIQILEAIEQICKYDQNKIDNIKGALIDLHLNEYNWLAQEKKLLGVYNKLIEP